MSDKLIIEIEKNDFHKHFNQEEVLKHKIVFSAALILKNLENEILKEYNNKSSFSLVHLIGYDTLGNADCLFRLIKYEETNDARIVTYMYDTTIS